MGNGTVDFGESADAAGAEANVGVSRRRDECSRIDYGSLACAQSTVSNSSAYKQ